MAYKNLIFDMDDTILQCGIYYQNCKDELFRWQANRTGIPKEVIFKIFNGIDIASTDLPNGFSKDRFPRSFAATSAALDIINGKPIDEEAKVKSAHIGESVFYAQYDPFPGAIGTLQKYKDAGFELFLYTKGVDSVQWFKIHKHKLNRFFGDMEERRVHIVPKKNNGYVEKFILNSRWHDWGTGETVTRILNPKETILIGDSLRDDVGSAISANIDSVHVDSAKPTWAYENTDNKPTYTISTLFELPSIIPV